MIARLIAWSARNLVLVFVGTVFAVAAGLYALRTLPLDAIPGPLGRPGHRLYGLPGPGSAGGRGPGHVSTDHGHADGAANRRWCAAFPSSASLSSTSSSRTAPIRIGRASRVLEYLNAAAKRLPTGVTPTLGPDATGVGWVYQYAVVAKERTLAELRSLRTG